MVMVVVGGGVDGDVIVEQFTRSFPPYQTREVNN